MGSAVDGAGALGGGEAGAPDDERGADAAFEEHAFAAAKRTGGTGTDFGAVVGADENQGVVVEGGIGADTVEQLSELTIHRLQHGVVDLALAFTPLIDPWPKRAVHVIRPEIHEERFPVAGGCVDERERGVSEAGGDP